MPRMPTPSILLSLDATTPGFATSIPTPPSSVISKRVRSKTVSKIIAILRAYQRGSRLRIDTWYKLALRHRDYLELVNVVKEDAELWRFTEDKIRYDYTYRPPAARSTFILRMPSLLHEVFLARIIDEINWQLRTIQKSEDEDEITRNFAGNIRHNGSPRLLLAADDGSADAVIRREPDASFKHKDARWPGVIIEVSYSQSGKDLSHLADDYILGTNGSINLVIGLDINYTTKKGSISAWRPEYIVDDTGISELIAAEVVKAQIFRDDAGAHVAEPGATLTINLDDFSTAELPAGLSSSLSLGSELLWKFLCEAEKEDHNDKQRIGDERSLRPGSRKRRREATPQEEIASEDDRHTRARVSSAESSFRDSEGD